MSELPLKATLKAGGGYDAPWLTVDAADPNDLAFTLRGLIEHESALQLVVEAANALKAVNNAAPISAPVAQAAPAPAAPAQQGPPPAWAQTPQAPTAAPAPQAGVVYHPEGIVCPMDQQPVIFKSITAKASGKTFQLWTCPNQKSKGDGHYSEFAN